MLVNAQVTTGLAGRRRFGGQLAAASIDSDKSADAMGGRSDEDEEGRAERLASHAAAGGSGGAAAAGAKGQGRKGAARALPSAADEQDLDKALAAQTRGAIHSASLGVARMGAGRGGAPAGGTRAQHASQAQSGPGRPGSTGGGSAQSQQGEGHFTPCPRFLGACPGQVFKKGDQGLGYYFVTPPQAAPRGKGGRGGRRDQQQPQSQQGKQLQGEQQVGEPANAPMAGVDTRVTGQPGSKAGGQAQAGGGAAAQRANGASAPAPAADAGDSDSEMEPQQQGHEQSREGMQGTPGKELLQKDLVGAWGQEGACGHKCTRKSCFSLGHCLALASRYRSCPLSLQPLYHCFHSLWRSWVQFKSSSPCLSYPSLA